MIAPLPLFVLSLPRRRGRLARWLRRHLTADGRQLARRLEAIERLVQ